MLAEIRSELPEANLLYVADRARCPYGTRSLEEVRYLSHEVADWLVEKGASTLVVACNTASAAALHSLRAELTGIRVVGMEPAVKPAALTTKTGVIAVFATDTTFQGALYDSVVGRHAGDKRIITRACPDWVELVESGDIVSARGRALVAGPVQQVVAEGADRLVLGCTHFSFLRGIIESVAGPEVAIVDPTPAVAAQTARVATQIGGDGELRLAASGDTSELEYLLRRLTSLKASAPVLPFPG